MSLESFEFGPFFLDGHELQLYRSGERTALNLKYTSVLYFLVSHAGRVVSKDMLLDTLWADTYVSDAALTQAIKEIRKHLGDSRAQPLFIKTHPKRGYQFIGEVTTHHADSCGVQGSGMQPEEKNIRTVFDRALHSYIDRGFLLEEQALHAVLPFAVNWDLGFTGIFLVIKSSLNCGLPLRDWLIDMGVQDRPAFFDILEKILDGGEVHQVYAVLQSLKGIRDPWLNEFLPAYVYRCPDRRLQRMVIGLLCTLSPEGVGATLAERRPDGVTGYMSYMLALALAREASSANVPLSLVRPLPSIFILLSLAYVRLRRHEGEIASGILGTMVGGAVGSCLLGLIISVSAPLKGLDLFPAMAVLGLFFGGVGGLFFALGFLSFGVIAYRHSPIWQVLGAVICTNFLGLVFYLGIDGLYQQPVASCGWREITLLTTTIALAAVISPSRRLNAALIAGLAGGLAGFIINTTGGSLFINSMLVFLETTQSLGGPGLVIANPLEGFVFGFSVVLAMPRAMRMIRTRDLQVA